MSTLSILPYAGIIFLQISSIDCHGQTFFLQHLHRIRIPEDNFIQTLPTWRSFTKLITFHPKRQNCLPNQISNLKRFTFYLFAVSSGYMKFVFLNLLQNLQLLVGHLINIVHQQVVVINNRKIILLSQSTGVQIYLNR